MTSAFLTVVSLWATTKVVLPSLSSSRDFCIFLSVILSRALVASSKIRIGAGVGSSNNTQAVAVGVGYAPTDRFRVNTKFSTSSTSKRASAISIGASVDLDW